MRDEDGQPGSEELHILERKGFTDSTTTCIALRMIRVHEILQKI